MFVAAKRLDGEVTREEEETVRTTTTKTTRLDDGTTEAVKVITRKTIKTMDGIPLRIVEKTEWISTTDQTVLSSDTNVHVPTFLNGYPRLNSTLQRMVGNIQRRYRSTSFYPVGDFDGLPTVSVEVHRLLLTTFMNMYFTITDLRRRRRRRKGPSALDVDTLRLHTERAFVNANNRTTAKFTGILHGIASSLISLNIVLVNGVSDNAIDYIHSRRFPYAPLEFAYPVVFDCSTGKMHSWRHCMSRYVLPCGLMTDVYAQNMAKVALQGV